MYLEYDISYIDESIDDLDLFTRNGEILGNPFGIVNKMPLYRNFKSYSF